MSGQAILDNRARVLNDTKYIEIKLYDIEIVPNEGYLASIIDEDISAKEYVYIEEVIYANSSFRH